MTRAEFMNLDKETFDLAVRDVAESLRQQSPNYVVPSTGEEVRIDPPSVITTKLSCFAVDRFQHRHKEFGLVSAIASVAMLCFRLGAAYARRLEEKVSQHA